MDSSDPTQEQLERLQSGDQLAVRELLPVVYDQLKGLARKQMARQDAGHTLQPTALVHEAWARLAAVQGVNIKTRAAFLALAATAMRTVLVDHARARAAEKRGGGAARVDLSVSGYGASEDTPFLLHLDGSIERLSQLDKELGRVAELRCFGGLTHQEIAEATHQSVRSVERHWRAARAWLKRELGEP